ncbi:hypothetical protein ACN9M0_14965 [Streptomyces sp. R-07]|uniref:hypothetical protein n=1 Tax=Streptomyces sp. R-07 TaxID=3404052 RepID=UPI003CEC5577
MTDPDRLSGAFSEVVEPMLSQRERERDLGLIERVFAILDAPVQTLHGRGVCSFDSQVAEFTQLRLRSLHLFLVVC